VAITIDELQHFLDTAPFHQFLKMNILEADKELESIKIQMKYRQEYQRIEGSGEIHGGVIASLVDIAGDFALIHLLGKGVPTINFRVDFLRPAVKTDLIAVAKVKRAGRNIGVVDIDVFNDQGRLVATGTGCYGTGY
jgi:uncharacterized protein (TIGR00369 family)